MLLSNVFNVRETQKWVGHLKSSILPLTALYNAICKVDILTSIAIFELRVFCNQKFINSKGPAPDFFFSKSGKLF